MNLKTILIGILANAQGKYMRKPQINKEVYKFAQQLEKRYTAESVGRTLRKLENKGIIKRKPNCFYAEYKYAGGMII